MARLFSAVGLAAAVFAAAAPLAPATAAPSRVMLGTATVIYDTDNWKASVTGNDGVTFTCVAVDCSGQPHVFANVESPREIAADIAAARRGSRTIADDGVPPLPFPAIAYRSSCRGADTPVLFAGGQIGGVGYRFTTAITVGCNSSPPLTDARFLELIRGFATD
jgi:hypothetical protein